MKKITVDLSAAAENRWQLSAGEKADAAELVDFYVQDIGGLSSRRDALALYDTCGYVDDRYRAEMKAIAEAIDRPYLKVLLANVYYDAFKLAMGSGNGGFACSAFVVDTPDGPVHARNLDWWTSECNRILSTGSRIYDFTGAPAGPFSVIGWPGYIGAISALAPGRFSITMNAVLSDEPFQMASPISIVIREVCETARTYADALDRLKSVPLMCDCLLLLAGVNRGEMAVIERSPTRAEVRLPVDGYIAVTNNYRRLGAVPGANAVPTSCERYDRLQQLMSTRRASAAYELISVLSDQHVKMETLTVQQMVLSAATGQITARAA